MALELSDTVLSLVDRRLQQLHTCIPARIINVENFATEQTIDVQVTVGRKYSDGISYDIPPLYDLPVVFPHGGGGIITFPVKVGDTVLVLFAERSIDEWLGGEGQNEIPFDRRSHDLSDAICIPGLFTIQTNLSPDPDNIQIRFNNSSITMKENNGDIDVHTDASMNIDLGTRDENGDVLTVGNLTATCTGTIDATAEGNITVSAGDFADIATPDANITAKCTGTISLQSGDSAAGSITMTEAGVITITGTAVNINTTDDGNIVIAADGSGTIDIISDTGDIGVTSTEGDIVIDAGTGDVNIDGTAINLNAP